MKICQECGTPAILGRDQEWNPDGTISLPKDKAFKMGFLEVDMFRARPYITCSWRARGSTPDGISIIF